MILIIVTLTKSISGSYFSYTYLALFFHLEDDIRNVHKYTSELILELNFFHLLNKIIKENNINTVIFPFFL